jgi:hypothetical protein
MTIIWVIILLVGGLVYRHTTFALLLLILFVYLIPVEGGVPVWKSEKRLARKPYDNLMPSAKRGRPFKLPKR